MPALLTDEELAPLLAALPSWSRRGDALVRTLRVPSLAEATRLGAVFAALADFPKPVVARLHGGVYGGGVGFACSCDIAVAGVVNFITRHDVDRP